MRILIIEDNQDILDIIGYIFNNGGHTVFSCTDGSSINNLEKIAPDVILLDQLLPNALGSDICRKIKANDKFKHIKIILISTIPHLEEVAKECGADGYIEKPFDIDALVALINEKAA